MEIANKNFLRPVIEEWNKYTVKDKKYMITANPITTRRLGPSGSLKNKKIILEHAMAITPKIINGVFFDLKYMFGIISYAMLK